MSQNDTENEPAPITIVVDSPDGPKHVTTYTDHQEVPAVDILRTIGEASWDFTSHVLVRSRSNLMATIIDNNQDLLLLDNDRFTATAL